MTTDESDFDFVRRFLRKKNVEFSKIQTSKNFFKTSSKKSNVKKKHTKTRKKVSKYVCT
tara:strand:+ start:571 stop:747 length:177 start_codon:yes stop_codon:yes gene_type:complete